MLILTIAKNAERVRCILEETYVITGTQMKKLLELDDTAISAAIGWLAREGKIYCSKRGGEVYISSKQNLFFFSF